jgi:hypothetical protein
MNKKGATEILHENIFTILILLFVFGILLYFINQQATGMLIEKQTLAKEICLMSLSAKSGTNIVIEHSKNLIIEKQENGILVNDKKAIVGRGYFYDCYGNFEINSLEEGKIEMIIK